MGLELIIIEKPGPDEKITRDKEIHSFSCNWYRDLHLDTYYCHLTMYTSDQLINFGQHLIDLTAESDDYSEDHLFKLIEKKYADDRKLKLIATFATCSEKYYEEHYKKYNISRLNLIAEVVKCESITDILSQEEIDVCESDSSTYYYNGCGSDDMDLETITRLVHFGMKLIKYGEKGYMGYWSI